MFVIHNFRSHSVLCSLMFLKCHLSVVALGARWHTAPVPTYQIVLWVVPEVQ